MSALTGKARAGLRREANGLTAAYQVGKGGVDAALVKGVGECLAKRELVKLKLLETSPVDARTAAQELSAATGAAVVQVIGRVVVLFLKKKKESAFDWV